jgi:hypothetical protein
MPVNTQDPVIIVNADASKADYKQQFVIFAILFGLF